MRGRARKIHATGLALVAAAALLAVAGAGAGDHRHDLRRSARHGAGTSSAAPAASSRRRLPSERRWSARCCVDRLSAQPVVFSNADDRKWL